MKGLCNLIFALVVISFWVLGLAVVKGFWMTTFAILPPVVWVCATQWLIGL